MHVALPGIVGVGYGGLRIVSRDDGLTWSDRVTDGAIEDIGTNLWSVAWGAGRWVIAGGARMLTSADGVAWTTLDLQLPSFCEGEWKETSACGPDVYGSSWHEGTWLAAGWPGAIRRSTDGVSYSDVYVDPDGFTAFDGRVFARGYVAP